MGGGRAGDGTAPGIELLSDHPAPRFGECRARPGTGGEKSLGTLEVSIRLVGIVLRLPIDVIRRDCPAGQIGIGALNRAG